MRKISKEDIASVRKPWVWDLGNQVLYDLCKKHPEHRTDEEIVAKVWLIGRSYAAAIERRKNAIQTGDDFYESTVAPEMKKWGIDSWLALASVVTDSGAPETIAVHKKLMDHFKSITDLEKRSLASKYLHFHLPEIFFIYDSRARQAIMKVVPRLHLIPDIPDIFSEESDKEYKNFVRRCVWLRDHIQKIHNTLLTPRELDKLLLTIIDGE